MGIDRQRPYPAPVPPTSLPRSRRSLVVTTLFALAATSGAACAADPTVPGAAIPPAELSADARPTRTLIPAAPGHAGSTADPTAGTTPDTAGGPLADPRAKIVTFTMPPRITCHGTVDVEVEATYRTTGANAVIFVIDGRAGGPTTPSDSPDSPDSSGSPDSPVSSGSTPAGSNVTAGTAVRRDAPTSGTFAVPLPCDGTAHTVVLTAVDAQGRTTLESRAILTETKPVGD